MQNAHDCNESTGSRRKAELGAEGVQHRPVKRVKLEEECVVMLGSIMYALY